MTTVIRYSDHDTKQDGGLKARYNGQEKEYSNLRMMYDNKRHQTHAHRIMRGRDNKPREARYGGSRYNTGPYDRKGELAWREKPWSLAYARKTNDAVQRYEPQRTSDEERSGGEQKKRLASCIVSPALRTTLMEENVTIRNISMARSLTYSPHATENALENEQIIGDLNGMELLESNDEEAMDYDVQEDDLLGEELMELEGHEKPADVAKYAEDTDLDKRAKKARGGNIAPQISEGKEYCFFELCIGAPMS
ncbi:Uncharacterized protein Rs2_44904 [Raphanus sativus]|nr:Uncharacterized protein Rs2_44904 [Raphanus sativus]